MTAVTVTVIVIRQHVIVLAAGGRSPFCSILGNVALVLSRLLSTPPPLPPPDDMRSFCGRCCCCCCCFHSCVNNTSLASTTVVCVFGWGPWSSSLASFAVCFSHRNLSLLRFQRSVLFDRWQRLIHGGVKLGQRKTWTLCNAQEEEDFTPLVPSDSPYILMVDRGECTFASKVFILRLQQYRSLV